VMLPLADTAAGAAGSGSFGVSALAAAGPAAVTPAEPD